MWDAVSGGIICLYWGFNERLDTGQEGTGKSRGSESQGGKDHHADDKAPSHLKFWLLQSDALLS